MDFCDDHSLGCFPGPAESMLYGAGPLGEFFGPGEQSAASRGAGTGRCDAQRPCALVLCRSPFGGVLSFTCVRLPAVS